MQTNRSNVGALVGGAIMIAFGLLALAGQIFRTVDWGFLWPFTVIGFGALFFVAMFAGGKGSAAFAIPGSIIGGIGLMLLFQNITHHWESMSYFWTLIIMFVGAGIYIMGWYGGDENAKALRAAGDEDRLHPVRDLRRVLRDDLLILQQHHFPTAADRSGWVSGFEPLRSFRWQEK